MSTSEDMAESQIRNEFGMPSTGWVHHGTGGVYAPVDNSQNKLLPWIAVAMLIAGIAVALAVGAMLNASRAERETRMLEFYILELDAKLVAAGYKTDAESIARKLKDRGEK